MFNKNFKCFKCSIFAVTQQCLFRLQYVRSAKIIRNIITHVNSFDHRKIKGTRDDRSFYEFDGHINVSINNLCSKTSNISAVFDRAAFDVVPRTRVWSVKPDARGKEDRFTREWERLLDLWSYKDGRSRRYRWRSVCEEVRLQQASTSDAAAALLR